jgi:hypothetical protein
VHVERRRLVARLGRLGGRSAYEESMRKSVFCLAVAGGGWGQRLIHAMASGCIPVVVQDSVHQPADDELPYDEFSVHPKP